MNKIIPITDFRKTNEISSLCHKENEPVIVTKNGYSDLVVMSIEAYEKLEKKKIVKEEIVKEKKVKLVYFLKMIL